jgi:hypothetical protein
MKCPKCGYLEPAGTDEQNRAMHALLNEYYKTGLHSAPDGYTLAEFKVYMKLQYGPEAYKMEFDGHEILVPKSWSHYTKNERKEFIDMLLAEILQTVSPLPKKMQEIIGGMNGSV